MPSLDIEILVMVFLWGSREDAAFPGERVQSNDHTLLAAAKSMLPLSFISMHVTASDPQ